MNQELVGLLQHSLGLDEFGRGAAYRNHFVGDDPGCRELVALGLMTECPASELTGGDPLFRVTDAGKIAVRKHSPNPPKLTRSQKRYLEYLNWSDAWGGTFREFLAYRKERAA